LDCPRSGAYALFRALETLATPSPVRSLWLSASQRFRFWLNGEILAEGPSRADPNTWGCICVSLPALPAGTHLFAVEVVQWGDAAGKGQIGPPGFLLVAGIDLAWHATQDTSRFPNLGTSAEMLSGHRSIGDGESFRAKAYPWGWQTDVTGAFDWPPALPFGELPGNPWGNRPLLCSLVPEPLPPMRKSPWPWLRAPKLDSVPPNSTRILLLDAGIVLNAIPEITWSDGCGASMNLSWCEAPRQPDGMKGNRDETEGCVFPGQEDLLLPDGGSDRSWSPPWIRSFRYLQLRINTQAESLTGLRIMLQRVSFPLDIQLKVEIDDPLERPWDRLRQISLDTALACSHETFFDCPAWEQAQFSGDARIQARHHYLLANDDRLVRKALRDLSAFRMPDGLLLSHAPSSFRQVIATYSLQWIGMLHEFRIYRGDAAFLRTHLACARGILEAFLARKRIDGLPGFFQDALFVDWTKAFTAGCAPQEQDGGSVLLAAMIAEACQQMAALEHFAGRACLADEWSAEGGKLLTRIRAVPTNPQGLLPDTTAARSYSVHTQVQAILAGVWSPEEGGKRLRAALSTPNVTREGTLYYRSYLAEAFRRCGDARGIWSLLPKWFGLLENTGLTTWPESDHINPRSDCHGWGAMPDIELVHSLLGLSPDPHSSGWERVCFAPFPGELRRLSATLPHPRGPLHIDLRSRPEGIEADIDSPVEICVTATGETLPPGRHTVRLPPAGQS
jgi:hypothetical protein